jgi:membrane associated rhomboid family serine protease
LGIGPKKLEKGAAIMSLTFVLMGLIALVSLLGFWLPWLKAAGCFSPYETVHQGKWWQLFTHGFFHADGMHLALNLWVFYLMGSPVESYLGLVQGDRGYLSYLALFVGGLLFSSLWALLTKSNRPNYRELGASGAVSSMLFAFILINPNQKLYFIFLPGIGIPSLFFGLAYLGYSAWMARRNSDGIAHDAHFTGALFGIGYMLMVRPELGVYLLELVRYYLGI